MPKLSFTVPLLSRLRRPKRRASRLRVTVYTRAQCCCCRKAIDLLERYRRRHGFALDLIDIDADPELRRKYDTMVPVVAIGGKVRFKGVVNPVLFERLLAAEGRDEG